MKKIVTLLLCAICFICLGVFVGCNGNQNGEHVCSWKSEVKFNEYYHYNECENESCEYVNIISYHEWQTELNSSSELGHYYACTFDGCTVLSAPEAHEWKTDGAIPSADGHRYNCTLDGCDILSPIEAHDYCLDAKMSGTRVQAVKTCEDCAYTYVDETFGTLAVNTLTAQEALDNLYEPTIITLNKGNYPELVLEDQSNIIIYAKENVNVELFMIKGDCKNICFYNVSFNREGDANNFGKAGIKFEASKNIKNITIKECTFRNNAGILTDTWETVQVANVKIKDCEFYNIDRCSYNGWRSAIVFYSVRGITIEGCLFDTVQRHAIQVYMGDKTTSLEIKNNVFKNIGGRVLDLYVYEGNPVDVSGNTFYQELCTTNENTYIHKTTGAYVNANRNISIGANTWEVMPQNTSKYFVNVTIDMTAQKLLQD